MGGYNVAKLKLPSPESHSGYVYSGFEPGTTVLKEGHVRQSGRRPFHRDTIYERDIKVTLRDGITLCTDVFRPADSDINKIPAILLWGPYGKTGNGRKSLHMSAWLCRLHVLQDVCTMPTWAPIVAASHGSRPLATKSSR